ncbi:hypothetical protein DR83_972 [Francisella tularensis subsp. novicida]|nr:hypothetical protein DR83_396 [Francisella tularensis subsp. novicida]KFJ67674.1 hypothetical protein DR83_972 [Francisella tularensis subsp. novicida]
MVIPPTDLPIAWLSSLSYPVAQACALAIVESSMTSCKSGFCTDLNNLENMPLSHQSLKRLCIDLYLP